MTMTNLSGAALITGAAKRLGRAMALSLAARGWAVAIHYHSAEIDAAATLAELRAAGAPVAAALRADLLVEAEVQLLVARAVAALGRPLTLLVNNASIFERDDWHSATRQSWDRHIESNLRAPFVLMQHFAAQAPPPLLVDGEPQAQAVVVNMIDQRVWKLTPAFVSYTVAKAALWTLTQTMAQALAPVVRVNGIGPGPTMANARQSPEHFIRQRAATLLQRGADAQDICDGLHYILSARSMTGQMLALDGGQHLNWQTPDVGIRE